MEEAVDRAGAEAGGGLNLAAPHSGKGRLQGLHGEGQGVEDRGHDQAGKREGEGAAGPVAPETADRRLWVEQDQEVEAEHSGR